MGKFSSEESESQYN